MRDVNLRGFDAIKADQKLINRTKNKIIHKQSRKKRPNNFYKIIAAAAVIVLVIVSHQLIQSNTGGNYANDGEPDNGLETGNGTPGTGGTEGGVHIPAIDLPTGDTGSMDMIGLIVYQGKVYTQTTAQVDMERVEELRGEKLGTTKPTIDEWSKQDDYATEFASSIGTADVYSVNGYDKDFRIMAYFEYSDGVFVEFYENLNGVTVYSGEDLFGKLNLPGNIISASYRKFSDWDYAVEKFSPLEDITLVNTFAGKLSATAPYSYEQVKGELEALQNDPGFRELILQLEDGTSVSLYIYNNGMIRYGYTGVYFKMTDPIFQELWDQLKIN